MFDALKKSQIVLMLRVRICQKDPVLSFLGSSCTWKRLCRPSHVQSCSWLALRNGQLDALMDWTARFSETGA